MIAFFLTVSLFLNLLCLLAIVILFQKQNRLQALEHKQQHTLLEIEDLLSSFLYEIKEENEQLQVILEKSQSYKPAQEDSYPEETDPAIQTSHIRGVHAKENGAGPSASLSKNSMRLDQVRKAYKEHETITAKLEDLPSWLKLEEQPAPNEMASAETLKDHIISLWKEGNTIEAIAKKVNKGKTEVELTLKFYGIL